MAKAQCGCVGSQLKSFKRATRAPSARRSGGAGSPAVRRLGKVSDAHNAHLARDRKTRCAFRQGIIRREIDEGRRLRLQQCQSLEIHGTHSAGRKWKGKAKTSTSNFIFFFQVRKAVPPFSLRVAACATTTTQSPPLFCLTVLTVIRAVSDSLRLARKRESCRCAFTKCAPHVID